MNDNDWRHYAACRGEDPEQFFPTGQTGPWELVIDNAKAVCRRCPVREQCLTWALDNHMNEGVWGGFTEKERQSIRRGHTPRTPAQCGTRPGYKKHRREGTPVCEPCQTANAEYATHRHHATKETAA